MNRLQIALLVAALLFGVSFRVRWHHVNTWTPDELAYNLYAMRVADGGLRVLPRVFADYHQWRFWRYPAPTRLLTALVFAVPMAIDGDYTPRSGALMSFLISIASMILVARIGYRIFGPWVGVLGAWFMACSFTELGLARRAWSDGLAGLCSLLMVWMACESQSCLPSTVIDWQALFHRRARWHHPWMWFGLFFLAGAAGMLAKETVAVGYAGVGAALVIFASIDRDWTSVAFLVAGGAGSVVLVLTVLAAAAGGFGAAVSALPQVGNWFHVATDLNDYAIRCCAGPWWHFPGVLLSTGPVPFLLCLCAIIGLLCRKPGAPRRP